MKGGPPMNPWKLTAIGLALIMTTALVTGPVGDDETGDECRGHDEGQPDRGQLPGIHRWASFHISLLKLANGQPRLPSGGLQRVCQAPAHGLVRIRAELCDRAA